MKVGNRACGLKMFFYYWAQYGGAVELSYRWGRADRKARRIFGAFPDQAEIVFYGSFAETYRGHGTDLAVVGGLLDFATDDMRIRNSIELAEAAGIELNFKTAQNVAFHPNTVELRLTDGDHTDVIAGASIGGGSVEIARERFRRQVYDELPGALVFHDDTPGMVAHITRLLEAGGVNIAYMDVDRKGRGGDAMTVVESDEAVPAELMKHIEGAERASRRRCGFDSRGGAVMKFLRWSKSSYRREDQVTIGQLMLNEQIKETGKSKEETFKQMADYYGIMKEAVHRESMNPFLPKAA